MRVALVSPYSWTYPGGVTRHIEALAAELMAGGHEVRVLRPVRPRHAAHRAAAPRRAPAGARACPTGWSRSAARSAGRRTAPSPTSRRRPYAPSPTLRRELRAFGPTSCTCTSRWRPVVGWDALTSTDAPLVGTFHCYSESQAAAPRRRPARRAPQAQPPARADRGLRGRGLDRPALLRRPLPGRPQRRRSCRRRARARAGARPGEPLRIVFVGQAVERKGLPVLLRAFEALRAPGPGRADDRRRHAGGDRAAARRRRRRDGARARRRRGPPAPRCSRPTCCAHRRWAASRSGWC